MSTSGAYQGNHVSDGGEWVYLNWQLVSQDVANNRSLINWQFGWAFVAYSCRGLRNGEAWVFGNVYFYDHNSGDHVHAFNSSHDHRVPDLQISSGSLWISHNVDGTSPLIGFYATLTGFSGSVSTLNTSDSLPTIPRVSSPPSMPSISELTQVSFRSTYSDAGDGAPVDSRQLSYSTGTDPDAGTIISSDTDDTVTGLTPATTYHVWARTHNVAGYSGWSTMATARTIAGARVNDGGVWKEAIPYVRDGGVWKLARPWLKSLGTWKETI